MCVEKGEIGSPFCGYLNIYTHTHISFLHEKLYHQACKPDQFNFSQFNFFSKSSTIYHIFPKACTTGPLFSQKTYYFKAWPASPNFVSFLYSSQTFFFGFKTISNFPLNFFLECFIMTEIWFIFFNFYLNQFSHIPNLVSSWKAFSSSLQTRPVQFFL